MANSSCNNSLFFTERDNRVDAYRRESREIDSRYSSGSPLEGILADLNKLKNTADIAGDEDYSTYIATEIDHYGGNRDYSQAIIHLTQALAWQKSKGFSEDFFILHALGISYADNGDENNAFECYSKAFDINPEDYIILESLAISYLEKDNFDKAIEFFDKALAKNPKDISLLRNLGVAYAKNCDYGKAIKHFDAALSLCKNAPDVLRNKGAAMYLEGQKEEGLQFMQTGNDKIEKHSRWNMKSIIKILDNQPALKNLRKNFDTCINLIDERNEKLNNKLVRNSKFRKDISFILFLRRWNSFTPAIPTQVEDSVGGGYFLWHNAEGTIIDPGYSFIENFHRAGGSLEDIHNIVITHSHDDHTNQFERILTLMFQYNRRRKEKDANAKSKRLNIYLSNGTFKKFSGFINLKEHNYITSVPL